MNYYFRGYKIGELVYKHINYKGHEKLFPIFTYSIIALEEELDLTFDDNELLDILIIAFEQIANNRRPDKFNEIELTIRHIGRLVTLAYIQVKLKGSLIVD
jgi:hypothetical protein